MTPLRVLRVITRLNIGGPAIHASILSSGLDPARFSTCLVIGEPEASEGDLSELVEGGSVRVVRLRQLRRPLRPWADAVALARLLRLVWSERPQILHTHMAKAGALGRLAGWTYNRLGPGRSAADRVLLIHTFHGHVLEGYFSPWLSQFFVTIERWLARRTDRLVAVSPAIRDQLLAKGIGRPEQWRVVPLGLDLSSFIRLQPPPETGEVRVGMVGRLVPIKNPSLFLQALYQLIRQDGSLKISGLIVGDGPLRQPLQREVEQLGLDRLVRFTGWRRDVSAVYADLDVACLTSWNEGTPVALIEAMAAGRPVVATDVGGVRDLLGAGPDASAAIVPGNFQIAPRGILIRPGDAGGLAAALQRLREDSALRRTLGAAGRRHASDTFSHQRLLSDMSALYDQVACLQRS
jgi:glycosyltransferase involved in cell wall biosynthesis